MLRRQVMRMNGKVCSYTQILTTAEALDLARLCLTSNWIFIAAAPIVIRTEALTEVAIMDRDSLSQYFWRLRRKVLQTPRAKYPRTRL